jgi:gluconate kinase
MGNLSTDINTCSYSNVLTNDYESILVRYMNQKGHFLNPQLVSHELGEEFILLGTSDTDIKCLPCSTQLVA